MSHPNHPLDNKKPRKPSQEAHRIKVLRQYAVLDTPPEQELDDLAAMAAHVCGTPLALISLVDHDRQWFKAKVGLPICQTPREQSICAHALDKPTPFIVPDAAEDERFVNNPLVTGEPGVRFYAGVPLITPHDATLGTLCVIDKVPRELTSAQESVLQVLARRVVSYLEKRVLPEGLRFRPNGYLSPGIHPATLSDLRAILCTNPERSALWLRLMSFLAWPILNQRFSHAYIGGDFVSDSPHPLEIDVILEPSEPFGPSGLALLSRFFQVGPERICQMYSVNLYFWMENLPPKKTDQAWFGTHFSALKTRNPKLSKSGMVQIDLQNPEITSDFKFCLDW